MWFFIIVGMFDYIVGALRSTPEFLVEVIFRWSGLLTGGPVVALAWWLEKRYGHVTPWRVLRWGMGVFLVASIYGAWYDKKLEVLGVHAQMSAKDTLIETCNKQLINFTTQLTNRDTAVTGRDEQIGIRDSRISDLQGRLETQQKRISDCLLELGKAQKPQEQRATAVDVTLSDEAAAMSRHHASIIMITNAPVSPVRGVVACRGVFKNAAVGIPGNPNLVSAGQTGMLAPSAYGFSILTPAWTPETPILITIFYDGDDPLPCNFHRS